MRPNQRIDRFHVMRFHVMRFRKYLCGSESSVRSRYKNEWQTFYKLNFHLIYYHSMWCREILSSSSLLHQSYFKTGIDNDVSIYFAKRRDHLCAYLCESVLEFFFQKLYEAIRLCSACEIARGIKSVLHSPSIASHSIDCRSDDRVSRFVSLDSIRENVASCIWNPELNRRFGSCSPIWISITLIFHTKASSRRSIGRCNMHFRKSCVRFFFWNKFYMLTM